MIRIREYREADLLDVSPRPIHPENCKEQFAKEAVNSKSYTLYESTTEKVLCVTSFVRLRSHVAYINMICDNAFVSQKKEFILVLREGVKHFMKELGLLRVHTTIRADFSTAEKWIKILGFEKEGLMRKFGPEGEDHFLFSKVVS